MFFFGKIFIETGKVVLRLTTNNPGLGFEVGLLYLNQQENIYKIDGYFIS